MDDEGTFSRRATPRLRSLKEAKVVLSDWSVIDCLIRDMSGGGARLQFGAATDLPDEFRLLIMSTNVLIPAARVWQRGLLAGIKSTGLAKGAPPRKF